MRRICGVILILGGAAVVPFSAYANGAFPDSDQVLVSSERPDHIVASTNFGLLISEDRGRSWRWVCEEAIGPLSHLYQLGPAPAHRLFALSGYGLHVSSDDGCTFHLAQGALSGAYVAGGAPHPSDPDHVFALARLPVDGGSGPMVLLESSDGGMTFGTTPLYVAEDREILSGVEISKTDPRVMYMTAYLYEGKAQPRLLRSADRGATWDVIDLAPVLGANTVRLIRVDPRDAGVIYLRIIDSAGDRLAIVRDAGASVSVVPLTLAGPMSAFLLREDGSIVISSKQAGDAHISTDGGQTFSSWQKPFGIRGLAEVGQVIYVTADNFQDGFVVGRSSDNGQTWQPLLQYTNICGLVMCPNVEAVCMERWRELVLLFGIEAENCGKVGSKPASADDGCACSASSKESMAGWLPALTVLFMLERRRRRRPLCAACRDCDN